MGHHSHFLLLLQLYMCADDKYIFMYVTVHLRRRERQERKMKERQGGVVCVCVCVCEREREREHLIPFFLIGVESPGEVPCLSVLLFGLSFILLQRSLVHLTC